jgi:eukaryotic-like serine/threonine-protein kinase
LKHLRGEFDLTNRGWKPSHSRPSQNIFFEIAGQPGSGGKWPVSTGGGVAPRWQGDGKELFYLAPDRKLMAVEVKAGSGFQAGRPPLFETSAFTGTPAGRYAVTADGQRFLINSEMEEAVGEPATVILNWTAALKQ